MDGVGWSVPEYMKSSFRLHGVSRDLDSLFEEDVLEVKRFLSQRFVNSSVKSCLNVLDVLLDDIRLFEKSFCLKARIAGLSESYYDFRFHPLLNIWGFVNRPVRVDGDFGVWEAGCRRIAGVLGVKVPGACSFVVDNSLRWGFLCFADKLLDWRVSNKKKFSKFSCRVLELQPLVLGCCGE